MALYGISMTCLGQADLGSSWQRVAADAIFAQRASASVSPGSMQRIAQTDSEAESAAPESRDSLFGGAQLGAEKRSARLSGSIEGLAAYTYARPVHWSRGVGRVQLVAQGEFAEDVKWKVGGRMDADSVYFGSDFYPDAVKHDQRVDFFWSENYLDFSAGNWAFRLGAQQIVWGEVVGLFFADVVSARDTREFLLPGFDIIRIPQWAARAEYFAGDAHLEIVWIPIPSFDRIGKPGADFYPVPLPSPVPADVAALFQDPERPGRRLSNSNVGVRANALLSGWDVSAFYYRSFSSGPTFYRLPGETPDQPFLFAGRYDRIWQSGATVGKDLGAMVLRSEAVYTHGQGYAVNDALAPEGVVKRSTLDYIVSVEYALPRETRLNVQAFQRVFYGGSARDLFVQADGVGASVFVSTKLTDKFEPQLLWIHSFRDAGDLIRPRLNWHAAKNVTVGLGADIFTGPDNGFFGRYDNRDRMYAEMRFDF